MWSTCLLLLAVAVVGNAFDDNKLQAVVIERTSSVESALKNRQLKDAEEFQLRNEGISRLLDPPLNISCLTHNNRMGRCMTVNECHPLNKLPQLNSNETWVTGTSDTCSYLSPRGTNEPFGVCCEIAPELQVNEETFNEITNESLDEPQPSISFRSTCGAKRRRRSISNKIVNGYEAIPHEYPFIAALMNLQRQFCGGSLIDKNHILTAAHCVAHMSKYDVQNLRVRLGDHNIKTDAEANHVEKRVKRVIRHKGFSSSTLWNDVAILTLEDDVQYTNDIQPICLAKGSNQYVDRMVTVAGWGTLREGGSQPASLQKVDVKVWTNERCKRSYGSSAPGGITKHMLCASEPDRDSCSGDSGGPLFDCPYNGACEQIGIVSWGIGCAQAKYPGVYTRVTEMMPWIQRIVRDY